MTPIGSSSGGTLRDVAAAAGVSPSTASRVLNGGKPVSDDLAKRVRAAAKRVGYAPHHIAQALRGRSNTISMIVDDPTTPTIAETVTGIQSEARAIGAVVTVAASGSDIRQQLTSVRTLAAMRPRAIILSGAWLHDQQLTAELRIELEEYERRGGHIVVVGLSHLPHTAITFDDYGMGVRMADHVAALPRRPVLILAGPPHHPAFKARTRGFEDGLSAAGITADHVRIEHSPISREGAAESIRRQSPPMPRAVVAANDILAVGAMAQLARQGVRVPHEVIVTGIDDIPIAHDLDPGLTTMALPFADVGKAALHLALDPAGAHRDDLTFSGELIQRGSTAI